MSVWTILKNYSYLSLTVCCISTPLFNSTRDAAIPLSDQVRFFGTRGHLKEKKKKVVRKVLMKVQLVMSKGKGSGRASVLADVVVKCSVSLYDQFVLRVTRSTLRSFFFFF